MSTVSEAMGLRGEAQNRPWFTGDPTEGDAFVAPFKLLVYCTFQYSNKLRIMGLTKNKSC
jgi:hypothetical protein